MNRTGESADVSTPGADDGDSSDLTARERSSTNCELVEWLMMTFKSRCTSSLKSMGGRTGVDGGKEKKGDAATVYGGSGRTANTGGKGDSKRTALAATICAVHARYAKVKRNWMSQARILIKMKKQFE